MQFKRLRTVGSLAFGGGLIALALTGCHFNANATGSSDSPSGSATPEQSVSPTSDGTGRREPVRSTGQGETPSCMAAELHADLLTQNSNSVEQGVGTLTLTNNSRHTCLVPAGWAPIGTGGPNDYTPLPATRTNYPGPGQAISLRAGSSVFAGMKWHTGPACGTTSGLGVAWNGSWIPIEFHDLNGQKPPICDSVVIGTIQPTMDGVNFT